MKRILTFSLLASALALALINLPNARITPKAAAQSKGVTISENTAKVDAGYEIVRVSNRKAQIFKKPAAGEKRSSSPETTVGCGCGKGIKATENKPDQCILSTAGLGILVCTGTCGGKACKMSRLEN